MAERFYRQTEETWRAERDDDWQPGRWWRVTAPDGSLWCETSVEREARDSMRSGDRLERQWRMERTEWREV